MTDQELIKFLRTSTSSAYNKVTADRIEELEKELNISRMASVVMDNTVEELEAKLAKAVEALREIVSNQGYMDDPWSHAAATLAELEGGE